MFYICYFWFFFIGTSTSLDIISPSQSIQDGESETLVSAGGTYELGFFSPGSSKGRYIGIWYKESPSTVVWVANRETQLNNTSGVLRVNDEGVLVLVSGTNSIVWLSNVSRKASNPIAQLLDSGNLVVRNENDSNLDNLLWQSFDYPCDTFLPGMKMGKNLETGVERFFSSWKSADDPGQGDCRYKVDHRGYPQGVQLKGNNLIARVGSWNGLTFTGCQAQVLRPKYELMLNGKEVYFEYKLLNESALSRFIISPSGTVQQFFWKGQTSSWEFVLSEPTDQCENYGLCGANSICNIINAPVCECLKGFVPKNPVDWNKSYWSKGCIRRIPLECNNSDRFQKYMGMKLPDTSSSWYSKTMDLKDCQESCLKNCSCTAYANLDIRNGGSGCLLWFDRVIDMRQHLQGGQELYIRLSASELDLTIDHGHDKFHKKKLYIGLGVGSSVLVMGLMALGFSTDIWKKKLHKAGKAIIFYWKHNKSKLRNVDIDLPTFDLSIIGEATNNFSSSNKLGEGGFGPVYKGTLKDGQELAVKRLSKSSGQGLVEFTSEVELIAKLQHRNLVKLLGCCIQGGEKMLIYEYMPNKSLDNFIFDDARSELLDWLKRFHIINGIARGLLYLHQDSRLRIIHRDLKTSNILLDAHMNPKISDFGLARAFGGDQVEANTNRVVGTYGYMPPEYAVHGHFSMKSDVFSFGVIVLEIVSGKKNRGFSDPEHSLNLLGHAWRLWTEEKPLELIDEFLEEKSTPAEVIRCMHVGLLCVQQKPEDRPDMSSVVLMLNGEKLLSKPNAPGFYSGRDLDGADFSNRNPNQFSPNEMSLSMLEAR